MKLSKRVFTLPSLVVVQLFMLGKWESQEVCCDLDRALNIGEQSRNQCNKLICVPGSQSYNVKFTRDVEQLEGPFLLLIDSQLNVSLDISPNYSKSTAVVDPSQIHVLIAKTIGRPDIHDTIQDIEELTFLQSNISVHWKVFCFEKSTYEIISEALANQTDVDFYFAEGRPKTYFWKKYMNPKTMIGPEVQYIMMVDGDTPLRFMGWGCFWDLVHKQLKPAVFMPAVMVDNPRQEKQLFFAGKAHYQKCVKRGTTSRNHGAGLRNDSNFLSLQAVETNLVDIQVPGFRREAWERVYEAFETKIPSWGNHVSDYGPDVVWCRLVESALNGGRLQNKMPSVQNWIHVRKTCHVAARSPTPQQAENLTCVIIHETPVYHKNTQTLKKSTSWHALGKRDLVSFIEAFPDFAVNRNNTNEHLQEFFRVFFSPRASSCQQCHTAECTKQQHAHERK